MRGAARAGGITVHRKIGAVLFGLAYAGSLVNGIESGVAYVSRDQEFAVSEWRWLAYGVYSASVALMGLLAGYAGRSALTGSAASAIGAGFIITWPTLFFWFEPDLSTTSGLAVAAFALGAGLAAWSSRWPASSVDLAQGRVAGVSWRHWLWLWLPGQYVVANVVWLGTPRFLLRNASVGVMTQVADVFKSAVGACTIAYAGFKAVENLRADAPLTRAQAALRFGLWFLVVPVLVNLWRLFL